MPKRQHSFACSVFTAAAVLLGANCASSTGLQAQDRLKFGVITHLTGPAAGPFGLPARNGAELVIDAINKGELAAPYGRAGFGGRQADMVLADEAGAPTRVATEVRAVIERDRIDALVGFVTSGTCLAGVPVAEELKVLTVLSTCATPRIFEELKFNYVVRTSANATSDGVMAARYLLQRVPDLKTYAGINQNFAFGQDSWRDFDLAMKALRPDASVVVEQFPNVGAGQYSAEISSLLAAKPQAVFSSFFGSDLEAFIFQMSPRNLHRGSQLVFTTGDTALRLGAKLPDGVIVSGRGSYGIFARKTSLSDWFRDAYEKRYQTTPTYTAYQAAQAILGLKIAYDRATDTAQGARPTTDAVLKAFLGLEYEAFGNKVVMNRAGGRQATTENALGVYKFDAVAGKGTVSDVVYLPADCVNPPDGTTSVDWLKSGMPGAKCN